MNDSSPNPLFDFRREVAEFLDTAPTAEIREAGRKTTSAFAPFEQVMAWQRLLHARGWAAPAWPVEHGGAGWSIEQRYIFAEEYAARDLPPLLPNGLQMVGPLLIEVGSQEQKDRYLPTILSGDDYWTQGYSEPGAGSDLASLQCRARVDGDDYIINGSKIWTTLAHKANRMFMLVRTCTDGPKQAGITFLLLDRLDYPGMTVRPIVGLDGVEEQCEVFFEDVRIPQAARVGAENDGWSVAKRLLKHERGGLAQSPMMRRKLAQIREAAQTATSPFGGSLSEDAVFQRDLGRLTGELASYVAYERQAISGHPLVQDAAFTSMNKVMSSELIQTLSTMMMRISGFAALAVQQEALEVSGPPPVMGDAFDLIATPFYLNSRATTIYAGTNEVQRDLIARTLAQTTESLRFGASSEQAMLGDMLRRYFRDRDRAVGQRDGGELRARWQGLGDLGLIALPFDGAIGGLDGSMTDLATVAREFGRALCDLPWLSTAILSGGLLAASAAPTAEALVQQIITGDRLVAFAHEEATCFPTGQSLATTLRRDGDHLVLNGHKVFVADLGSADAVIVSATCEDGTALLLLDAAQIGRLDSRVFRTLDGRSGGTLTFRDVAANPEQVIARDAASAVARVVDRALLLIGAETLGICEAVLTQTVLFAQTRHQFGVPIASFQVIAHRLADMKIAAQRLFALVLTTAEDLDRGEAAGRSLSVVKAQAGRIGRTIAEAAIQIHGGVALTDDLAIGHYLKRLLVIDTMFGTAEVHERMTGMEP